MADRVSVTITVGGAPAAADRDAFVATVKDEGLSVEWDGPDFDAEQLPRGEPLRLHAHEVAWGRLDDLEAFCVARALPFARWSGGHAGSFGPEIVVFAGAGEPRSFAADEDERPVMSRETAMRLGDCTAIMTYFDEADFTMPPLVVEL